MKGAILFDNVENIQITNTQFEGNTALNGASLACINGRGNIKIDNVQFSNDQVTDYYDTIIDIYSDGSCTSPFWYTTEGCTAGCSSCNVSILIAKDIIGYMILIVYSSQQFVVPVLYTVIVIVILNVLMKNLKLIPHHLRYHLHHPHQLSKVQYKLQQYQLQKIQIHQKHGFI